MDTLLHNGQKRFLDTAQVLFVTRCIFIVSPYMVIIVVIVCCHVIVAAAVTDQFYVIAS